MTKKLDWRDRPGILKAAIDQAYLKINDNPSSLWGKYNGQSLYCLGGICDELMIEKLIVDRMNQGQTEFIFMDIGAGNFQWGRHIADFLNNHPIFKNKIKVDIYSLRGESNLDNHMKKQGIYKLYEHGKFKIENLVDELKLREHDLLGKVDLIVSSWCFRHLVDPAGTLLQAYELLKVGSGMIFIDGFFLSINERDHAEYSFGNMIDLIDSFRAPSFRYENNLGRRNNVFVIQKSTECFDIPLTYKGIVACESDLFQIGSGYVTTFDYDPPELQIEKNYFSNSTTINGLYYYVTNSRETQASKLLLDRVIVDCEDVKLAKYKKIIELFKAQIEANDIYRLLKDLIDLDEDKALVCIRELLSLNNNFALTVLNHIPYNDHDVPLLHVCAFCSKLSIINELFNIATPEVLNYRMDTSDQTLLMYIMDNYLSKIDTWRLELAEKLLLSPHVDVTIESLHYSNEDIEDKTVRGFCRKSINTTSKEMEYEDNIVSNGSREPAYLDKAMRSLPSRFELLTQFQQLKKLELLIDTRAELQKQLSPYSESKLLCRPKN